ncbi:MAG: hypothetical protein M3167_19920 [Acidobacteriota bacterium]|nr:hypothetical protein [Acidobacteriota bacterium]
MHETDASTGTGAGERLRLLESEIERRLSERFAALRDEFDRLRVESDQRWVGFLGRFEQDFRGLVPPELLDPPKPAAGDQPDRPAGAGLLSIEIARSMDDAGNQVEALHRFLELCRRHASRAALLISKGGSFAVWKAAGFGEHGGNDEAARRISLPLDGGPLSKVIDGSAFRLPAGNDISARLGASDAVAAVLVPMVVKEKVSGAVYADCTAEDASRFDAESIAFLTFLAGLFVDRLAARKLKPAPALRPLQDFQPAAAPVSQPDFGPEPEPDRASVRELEAEHRPVRDSERETERDDETPAPAPGESHPRPPRDSYGTQILSSEESAAIRKGAAGHPGTGPDMVAQEAERAPASSPPPAAPAERPMHHESEASLAYEPDTEDEGRTAASAPPPEPPPVQPVAPPPAPSRARPSISTRRLAGPLAPPDGDERREEARRFAKLLVSEIKLYNEKAVQEGRTRNDLYSRLKEDIDRSRQMYDERIPADVRSSSNFFYEELVRILADGRAEALGI